MSTRSLLRLLSACFSLASTVLVSAPVQAAPTDLAVQGWLSSAAGGPAADGNYPLGLALYDQAAGGTALALSAPTPYLAITAFVFAGLGLGNIAPVLFAGGGRLEPDAPGRGIAAVTTLGYSGFLLGPPLIGFAAQLTDVNTALFITVIAALIIAIFARSVRAADTY